MGGSRKVPILKCMYLFVCIICLCFIEQIWLYIQTNFTFQASKSSNWPIDMYVCMFVCMILVLQNPQFLRGSAISVYSPTRKSKNRPQTVSRSTFSWRFWQGPVLRFSRSIHPYIHTSIHTDSVFMRASWNPQFSMYVKPFLHGIYRRFWNIQTNLGCQKVVTSKCMYVCLALFAW